MNRKARVRKLIYVLMPAEPFYSVSLNQTIEIIQSKIYYKYTTAVSELTELTDMRVKKVYIYSLYLSPLQKT